MFRVPGPARHPRCHLALTIVALLSIPGLAGCKGFGSKATDTPVAAEPPLRKPGAFANAASQAKKEPAPVRLDGSASGENGLMIPNAPGIVGAPALAGNASIGEVVGAGASDKANEALPVKTAAAESSEEDEEQGPILPVEGLEKTPRVVRQKKPGIAQEDPPDSAQQRLEVSDEDGLWPNEGWTAEAAQEARGKLKPIEIEDNGTKVDEGEVAAIVNGVPIFSYDVIRQLPPDARNYLAQLKQHAPPEAFREARRKYLKLLIKPQIEQELILHAMRSKLKEQQIADINKQIDQHFDKMYLPEVMKHEKVNSAEELEMKLREKGSSIEEHRANFRNKELVRQYLGNKSGIRDSIDRPDVLAYYKEHLDQYAIPAKVKWEQIQIKFAKQGGKAGARKKAGEIVARLEKGESFTALAKECSDGPTAAKGGQWGWTIAGNLADKDVDEALFEVPVGKMPPPIETENSIHILRVIDRTEAGHRPFEEVQEDIRNVLRDEQHQKRVNDVIAKLRENATIEDFIDQL